MPPQHRHSHPALSRQSRRDTPYWAWAHFSRRVFMSFPAAIFIARGWPQRRILQHSALGVCRRADAGAAGRHAGQPQLPAAAPTRSRGPAAPSWPAICTARIPVRGTQDELDRLADTINAMLDRIAALMENLRQVTNDIAHDLRTPVTPSAPSAGAGARASRTHRGLRQGAGSAPSPPPTRFWPCSPPCCASPRSKAAPAAPLSRRWSWPRC